MNLKSKEIILRAKKSVYTGNLGNNLTSFKGDGIDFAEIREYNYGDDVRKINWKATAKSGNLKINEFNEERELHIVVACMLSGGLNFGVKRLKQDVMAELVALLGFSALINGDRFELILFSDTLHRHFKPTKSSGVIEAGVSEIVQSSYVGKEADYANFTSYLQSKLKKRAIVIVLGDFFEDGIDLSPLIKHQLYAINIRDHFEEEPNISADLNLVDPNTLNFMELTLNKGVVNEYKKELLKHDNKLKEHFLEYAIAGAKVYTDDDLYLRATQIFKG
jgi:uncharacterized protein (DUF58 family)